MRKLRLFLASFLIVSILFSNVIYAKTTTLVKLSKNTYVYSDHEDWSFDYVGTLSINGLESFWIGGYKYVPTWISMKYTRKGTTLSYGRIYENGGLTVKSNVYATDSIDLFGNQTQVFYDYGKELIGSSMDPMSLGINK